MNIAPEYGFHIQAKIPPAMAALHNFIRIHDPTDTARDMVERWACSLTGSQASIPGTEDEQPDQMDEERYGELGSDITPAERIRASERRDTIAKAMWADYQRELNERGEGS